MKPVINAGQHIKIQPKTSLWASVGLFFSAGTRVEAARQDAKDSSLKIGQIIEQSDRSIAERNKIFAQSNQVIEESKNLFNAIDQDIASSIARRSLVLS